MNRFVHLNVKPSTSGFCQIKRSPVRAKIIKMAIAITCGKCGKSAVIERPSLSVESEEFDARAFIPPTGFRKVAIAWNALGVHIFCVDCGVAAQTQTIH
jgi:hypothetical protein